MNTTFDVVTYARQAAGMLSKSSGKSRSASERDLRAYLQAILDTINVGEEEEIIAQTEGGCFRAVILKKVSDDEFIVRPYHDCPEQLTSAHGHQSASKHQSLVAHV
jgi:hypothetical protein